MADESADSTRQDEVEIAEHLNSLNSLGLRNMASEEEIRGVISDYFLSGVDSEDEEEEENIFEDHPGESATLPILPTPPVPAIPPTEESLLLAAPVSVSEPAEPGPVIEDSAVPSDVNGMDMEPPPTNCCRLNGGKECHTHFTADEIQLMRMQYMGLTKEEKDITIMEALASGQHVGIMTQKSKKGKQEERKATRTDFYMHGFKVCRKFFIFSHFVSGKVFKNVLAHYKSNGFEPRVHGNIKRQPANSLSFDIISDVYAFIWNFAEANAIILPGRQPYSWKTDCKLLPTNCSKAMVYREYKELATRSEKRIISYRSFARIWKQLLPFVTNLKPATDLCWYCQQRSVQLQRCVNLPLHRKSQAAQEMVSHLNDAAAERSLYVSVGEEVRRNLPADFTLGKHEPCSFAGKSHYSFDFAQQVHYPCDPQQPGPIFFKTPRKCGLFGVHAEGLSKQINFLLDEAWNFGKGANCVVSLLHFFFENYGLGETEVHLHADNCCGQNKNNTMLQYLLWRVLSGRHHKITLSFLLAGHTKFACDWSFGLIKRLFRKTKVGCLQDIVKVVEQSSVVNNSQCCITENGDLLVSAYDWTSFLDKYFTKLPKLLSFHHFHFTAGSGVVGAQEFCTSPVQNFHLLKAKAPKLSPSDMPISLTSTGLDLKRQWYLYKEIRPFVPTEHQDSVAPLPGSLEPGTSHTEEPPLKVSRVEAVTEQGKGKGKGKGRGKGRKQ